MNTALVLAGGSGLRLGSEIPKQFLELAGKPIVVHTLQTYQRHREIDEIAVVCREDYIGKLKQMLLQHGLDKVRTVIPGGKTFMDSCRNGVYSLKDTCKPDDIVLIISADLPLITDAMISDSIRVCSEHGNAVSASPCQLCVCRETGENSTTEILVREELRTITTPWSFKYSVLSNLLEKRERGELKTKEPYPYALLIEDGGEVFFSSGDENNVKVIFNRDLPVVEALLLKREAENKKTGEM